MKALGWATARGTSSGRLALPLPTSRVLNGRDRRPRGNAARANRRGTGSGSGAGETAKDRSSSGHKAATPLSDRDLLEVLELASDDELEQLHHLLFARSLLSPVVKSVVREEVDAPSVQWHGREALMMRIEHRFRFLAADAAGVLAGRWPSYRETLVLVRDRLGVRCPSNLATHDLETEIFLHLLSRHAEAMGAVSADTVSAAAVAHALEGDGMALPQAVQAPNPLDRLLSPLRLGAEEVLPALTKLAGAVAVRNLQGAALRRLATDVVRRAAQYESAVGALLAAGGKKALRSKAAVQAAQQGLTAAASRYAAVRSALALATPVMWALACWDLLQISLGTDYARVCRAIFCLAQVRLLRTHGFSYARAS